MTSRLPWMTRSTLAMTLSKRSANVAAPGVPQSRCWPQPGSPSVASVSDARLRARGPDLTSPGRSRLPERRAPATVRTAMARHPTRRWRSTSAARSSRRAASTATGACPIGARRPRPPDGDAEALFGAARRPGRRGAPAATRSSVRRRLRRADGARAAATCRPLNIPAWRDFPLRDRLAELTGLPVHVDNDAKALALGEGWVGRGRAATATSSRWSCRPGSAAASCSTAGCSTAPPATPGTSAT